MVYAYSPADVLPVMKHDMKDRHYLRASGLVDVSVMALCPCVACQQEPQQLRWALRMWLG